MKTNGFIKENRGKIVISSILILLPIIAGCVLWNKLPETMVTHWGINNEPNGFSSKAVAVFVLPLFLLGIHLLCLFATSFEKRLSNVNKRALCIVFWICPVLSVFVSSITFANALNYSVDVGMWAQLLIGVTFCIVGNYMPKVKQNYVYGVKVPWTLKSEENWNKTHRFAGIVFVIVGLVTIISAFLQTSDIMVVIAFIFLLSPVLYSYIYYVKYEKGKH